MKYMGAKSRIAKDIVPIIQKQIDLSGYRYYIEPFVGGANVIDKITCPYKVGMDSNEYLIDFWVQIQSGWNPLESVDMSKSLYTDVKDNMQSYPKSLVALCGLCATYNAKWFGGYAGTVKTKIGTERNYYDEAVRNVLRQRPNVADVYFFCLDYSRLRMENAVIYCDPPYQGTAQYKDAFSHDSFWEWVRCMSRYNIVLCSEYAAPEDFTCIWSKELTNTLDNASRSKAIERLFVYKYGQQPEGGLIHELPRL